MKHKITLICCLLLVVAMLFSSCKNNADQNESEPEETTSESPLLSEEDILKQKVLDLMETSEAQEDPAELFANFAGDYTISGFATNDAGVKEIKRKNAVTEASSSYATYYGVEAAGFLFYASYAYNEAEVIADLSLYSDASDKSTVFTTFGIDTSAIYGTESEGSSLKLTADMLTVGEDNTTCTFSDAYLDELAKEICEAMGYTAAQTESFLKKYKGSGVYSAAENKITFEIQINDSSFGKLRQITTYAIDEQQKVNASAYMEYSNPTLGITTPIVCDIQYQDIIYRDNTPISATIQITTTSDASYYDGNYGNAPYISATETVTTTFKLDCSDHTAPKASAVCKKTITETYQGESSTYNTHLNLTVDLGKASSQFSFTEKQSNEIVTSLKANKVTFATPTSFSAVPQKVTNAITNYITNS